MFYRSWTPWVVKQRQEIYEELFDVTQGETLESGRPKMMEDFDKIQRRKRDHYLKSNDFYDWNND